MTPRLHVDPSDWRAAKYPGDAVFTFRLSWGDALGVIEIRHYKGATTEWRTCAFVPGVTVFVAGDSPKTLPDESEWFDSPLAAYGMARVYLARAERAGWHHYDN